jgi:hypothetical protein
LQKNFHHDTGASSSESNKLVQSGQSTSGIQNSWLWKKVAFFNYLGF